MMPRGHVLLGIVFVVVVSLLFPSVGWLYLLLIFLASVLIDFDHYAALGWNKGIWGLKENVRYHKIVLLRKELVEKKKGIFRKGYFHLFHTFEFHVLVWLLGYLWVGFFYVFEGMLFHSLCDFVWLVWKDRLYRREYWWINWLRKARKPRSP